MCFAGIFYDKISFMNGSRPFSSEWIDIIQNLRNIRFNYQILFNSPEKSFETKMFEDPQEALDFYTALSIEQNPQLKCLITGSLGNFFYSCIAPLRLRSLADIVDAGNEIPFRIKETATKALARRIHDDLPFNSETHGFTV